MRRAARIDDNHRAIAAALKRAGCEVLSLAAVANGCPDLLVNRGGTIFMLEVKDGSKPPSERRLTRHQAAFHQRWPVAVVCNELEALKVVGLG